jgi:hypothetical protein
MKERSQNQILKDHKRIGKRFIPPLLQIPDLQLGRYPFDKMPELVWIASLQHRVGILRGSQLALDIAFRATQIMGKSSTNFAFASGYSELNNDQKQELIISLLNHPEFRLICSRLAPLANCYPSFPLGFIVSRSFARKEDIRFSRAIVRSIISQRSQRAMMAQAGALRILLTSGKIHILEGVQIPDLNPILDYPKTSESRLAGSTIRSLLGGIFASSNPKSSDWCETFWVEGRKLSLCR